MHHPNQGFVPANNDVYTSETIIPAAFAAIDDINANCSILPDHKLELEFVDTKVSLFTTAHLNLTVLSSFTLLNTCPHGNRHAITHSHNVSQWVHIVISLFSPIFVLHSPSSNRIQCDPSEATWQLINSIVLQEGENDPRILFLGGGCSLATEPLAALAGRFYKISMVRA